MKKYFNLMMFLAVSNLYSQQDPMYTQYAFNMLTINPAYSGTSQNVSATFLTRLQWVGVDGAPVTNTLSIHSPIMNDKLGVGFSLIQDKIGPNSLLYGNFDLSYHMRLTYDHILSFGMKAGVTNYWTDLNSLNIDDDPLLSGINHFSASPSLGTGIYLYHEKYYLGASVPRMVNFNSEVNINEKQYFLTGGFYYELSRFISLRPTALLRLAQSAPVGAEITPSILIYDVFLTGLNIKSNNELSVIIQFWSGEQLKIGYGYDFPYNSVNKVTYGSHEFMISYDFSSSSKNRKRRAPSEPNHKNRTPPSYELRYLPSRKKRHMPKPRYF